MAAVGGQTIRTPEIEDALVEGLAGGITLRQLCREHGIGKSTVYDWIDADDAFAGRIARARKRGFDELAEETLDIADDARNDWIERDGGGKTLDAEHVQRSKLRIETRLKLLAKWDSGRYGERITHAGDPDSPLVFTKLTRTVVDPKA